MADQDDRSPEIVSDYGMTAFHRVQEQADLLVAPAFASGFNTVELAIVPVACLSLADVVFEFDSSFVMPSAKKILSKLPALREERKDEVGQLPSLSVFGHADPSGQDEYNKQLSGRRAKAVFGLLTHQVSVWKNLYNEPLGGDNWKHKSVAATMRDTTGMPVGALFSDMVDAYMTAICPVTLTGADFLAKGADSLGKGDYQGCGEFNPLLLLSRQEQEKLPKEERDVRNSANRRVLIYLFRPGTTMMPDLWPCPRTNENTAGCRQRFFSNGDKRRSPAADVTREHETLQDSANDTFACRFYARIGGASPCEKPKPTRLLTICLFDPFTVRISEASYRITVGHQVFKTKADPDGFVKLRVASIPEDCLVEWGRAEDDAENYLYSMKIYLQMEDLEEDEEVKRRLHNLGYSYGETLADNVKRFQLDYGFDPTGQPADVISTLRQWYDDATQIQARPDANSSPA
jgi:hypothetical protein